METIWQKNLRDLILLDPLVLIHGNVKDLFFVDRSKRERLPHRLQSQSYVWFDTWLSLELEAANFSIVLLYDPIDGVVALRGPMAAKYQELATTSTAPGETPSVRDKASTDRAATQHSPTMLPPQLPASTPMQRVGADDWMVRLGVRQKPDEFFRTLYHNVFPRVDAAVGVICRFTDRFLSYTDRQDTAEKELSLLVQKAAMAIPPTTNRDAPRATIVLLFDLEGSIPQELSVQSPFARSIRVPPPGVEEREHFFRENHQRFFSVPNDRFDPQDADHVRDIANLSDGLKTQDLLSLITLSNRENVGLGKTHIKALLDRFKFGTRENAWVKVSDEALRNAKERLRADVKGQDEVIDEVVPTLVRAKLGMSDISVSKYSSKPRGVFFFVGPTGVGKTELSKAIAKLIFGDEAALLRFDMSEYSEEHQQARLIGAPPGYVGFDQGGQLTNGIMQRPFSVVLFDEIEKAHGRILDKFLQILDDGRLTDGMGRTVYFSEAILIFTSNIGTASQDFKRSHRESGGQALATDTQSVVGDDAYGQLGQLSYDELCKHFREAVSDYFVRRLGRPEILNRIGEDNILVFNLLKDENVKSQIIAKQVSVLDVYLTKRYRISLRLTPTFVQLLHVHPGGFERNGARGVSNLLSKLVMNRLAEELFADAVSKEGKVFQVDYCVKSNEVDGVKFNRSLVRHKWRDA